jgi:hypothetical protein
MHPAKLLLCKDIKSNLHITTYKTPAQLQASRAEYKPFKRITNLQSIFGRKLNYKNISTTSGSNVKVFERAKRRQ